MLSSVMNACPNKPNLGTYGYDVAFLKNNHISCIELSNNDGKSKVLISPGYQGRVMTTTAEGDEGKSFGWLNYKLISSGIVNPQFNPIGGEERFWLGPEGGAQGDSLNHVQNIIHIQAEEEVLEPILENLFGLNFKSLFEAL